MAVELTFQTGGRVLLQQSQLKNHLYYADAGIAFGTEVVTHVEKVGYDEEFVTLYEWRVKKDDGSGSGSRLDDVIENEQIDSEALHNRFLE